MFEQVMHVIEVVSVLLFAWLLFDLGRLNRKLNRQIRATRPAAPTPADEAINTSRAALDQARAETSELRALVTRLGAMADDLKRFNDQNDVNHKREL